MDYVVERHDGYIGRTGTSRSNKDGTGTFHIVFVVPTRITDDQIEVIAMEARKIYEVERLDNLDKATADKIGKMVDRRVMALL